MHTSLARVNIVQKSLQESRREDHHSLATGLGPGGVVSRAG